MSTRRQGRPRRSRVRRLVQYLPGRLPGRLPRRVRSWFGAPPEPVRTREIRIDERTSPARLTLRVITGARRFTVPAALLSITHQLGEALVPVLMGLAIERAVSTGDVEQLLLWVGLLAADFAVLSFSWRFGSRLGELGTLVVQHQLRSLVSAHLLTRSAQRGSSGGSSGSSSTAPGVALSLATSDVNRLASAVAIGVYPAGQLAAVMFGGTVLLVIWWPLGLAVLFGAPAVLWLTDRTGGSLRHRSADEQDAAATAAGEAADLMAGYRVLKGIHAEDEAGRRYRRASRAALTSTLQARRAEGIFVGTMDLATGLFVTAITVAAGVLALRGAFGIVELVTIVGLTQFLLSPLQSLARNAGTLWAAANASAGRLLDLLREEPGWVARGREPGAAPSDASAASTPAVGALAAFARDLPDAGLIAVSADARSARAVLETIRAERPDALVVPHEAHLFAGSVRENVTLPGVPAERAAEALDAAGCRELADVLPDGWETPVGEGGAALSGGQRQRVALARALAQDAQLLVLHDPTTAVDAVTEAAIADRLRRLRAGRRTVIVTRSPALLQVADRVVDVPDVATAQLAMTVPDAVTVPDVAAGPGSATAPEDHR